jgi:Flp pilus assembly protein TadG
MRRLIAFLRAQGGAAAVEFGLVAPILVSVLVLGIDGWMRIQKIDQMRTAVQTGARYYQTDGLSDSAALAATLAAWPKAAAGSTVTVSRTCKCGALVVICTSVCNGVDPPETHIAIRAQSTYNGLIPPHQLVQQEVVRVR